MEYLHSNNSTFGAILMTICLILAHGKSNASSEPTIVSCETCDSSFDYINAAINGSDIVLGQSVTTYVINYSGNATRVYDLTLTMTDSGFGGEQGLDLQAIPVSGDATVMSAIDGANSIMDSLMSLLNGGLTSEQLGLPSNFNSAVDLLGPTGSASLNRKALENALSNYYGSFLQNQVTGTIQILRGALAKVLGSGVLTSAGTNISFPDGTSVTVRIRSVGSDPGVTPGNLQVIFEFEVDVDSVQAADENVLAFPNNSAEFSGFIATELSPSLSQELYDLALRFGIEVSRPEENTSCSTNFTCTSNNQCTLTLNC